MSGKKTAVFVDRRGYRRRRMTDAARLLPILGAGLICIPLLWKRPEGTEISTSSVMIYLFLVWGGLALLAAVISRYLAPEDISQDREGNVRNDEA
ncbi:hypothetical protein ROA7450_02608 [Roseovarius albus]|uniref:Uncharacterized protein n=1 Tax=Roseovarius albus TaxID=1247867 RepID=A0A1X6ZI55_9RHOB|nr:hypothetical protein [Roseovarius albus]SLN51766.1 hypothetical protein ROA7450_02608 [Roseovarius albus]